ncbi:MAG: hypothetical protein JW787_16770 [Sedimentisphaerales bacterium]|nr:hypothetical protein [Sedimentisphaerales bacterium]
MLIYLHNIKFRLILLAGILSLNSVIYANDGIPTFNISIPRTTINVGEPLVGQLEFHFKEPQLSNKKEIIKQINAEHDLYFSIEKEDAAIYKGRYAYRVILDLQDEAGLDYKGTFIIWYDVLGNKIFFDKPGEYTVRVGLAKELLSNPVKITVKSENKKAQEALQVLTEREDYLFLFVGLDELPEKRAGILERVKKVLKQSEGTMLEKWSAARLGVACFKDVRYGKEKEQSKIDEIHEYLNKGIELPDDFPDRDEVLYDLGSIEAMKGNKIRAETLWDEVVKKYPKGQFARTVLEVRKQRVIK